MLGAAETILWGAARAGVDPQVHAETPSSPRKARRVGRGGPWGEERVILVRCGMKQRSVCSIVLGRSLTGGVWRRNPR